jgi:hypothetical protein
MRILRVASSSRWNAVIHSNQKQAACRRRRAGTRTRTAGENRLDILDIASAYLEKSSHKVTDHVVEEPIPLYPVEEQRGLVNPDRTMKAAHVVVGRTFGIAGGKGGEVEFAANLSRGPLHSFDIERRLECVDIACLPGRANLPAEDPVLIGFRYRAVARVKVARHPRCAEDADRRRERSVECTGEIRLRDGCGQRKRRHLTQRVHACVRPAGALGQHVFAGDPRQCIAQFALHRYPIRLNLPAVEFGTVIGKYQFPLISLQLSTSRTIVTWDSLFFKKSRTSLRLDRAQ